MQIWTDASFNDKTKEAGLGILVRKLLKNGIKETKYAIKCKADDNNQAELLAILYGLRSVDNSEKIHIITDSQTAIDCIHSPESKPNKYKYVVRQIQQELKGKRWKIYHKKGHSRSNDRYSNRQEVTDLLAKCAKKLDNSR
jgi:ribonuclease HI